MTRQDQDQAKQLLSARMFAVAPMSPTPSSSFYPSATKPPSHCPWEQEEEEETRMLIEWVALVQAQLLQQPVPSLLPPSSALSAYSNTSCATQWRLLVAVGQRGPGGPPKRWAKPTSSFPLPLSWPKPPRRLLCSPPFPSPAGGARHVLGPWLLASHDETTSSRPPCASQAASIPTQLPQEPPCRPTSRRKGLKPAPERATPALACPARAPNPACGALLQSVRRPRPPLPVLPGLSGPKTRRAG